VDLVRFGVVIRALRRRRGWRQVDLAAAASVSQDLVSLIERGLGGRMPFETLSRVGGALEARVALDIRWRGGELDRLLDDAHAALTARLAQLLTVWGWEIRIEVTYDIFGSKGSIDVFAWYADTATLLVIEIKTEIAAGEATLRKLDEKVRLAARIASERFQWRAASVWRLLVVEGTSTARRRIGAAPALFDAALPTRGSAIRRWLRGPSGAIAGVLFVAPTTPGRHIAGQGGRHRVRKRPPDAGAAPPNVAVPSTWSGKGFAGHSILTNRTYDDPES
jgi:transcriptional regulator with XRE-family HTH domain